MNDYLKVVVAQSPGQLHGQQERMDWLEQQLESISDNETDLFILPELFLSGYNIGTQLVEKSIDQTSTAFERIVLLAKKFRTAIHFSYPEKASSALYNSSSCISKTGEILGTQRKLLFPPGFERDIFEMGSDYDVFKIGSFKIGTLICYDAEFPENFRNLGVVDLVVIPTALFAQWSIVANKVIPTRAFENGVFACYANHSGTENGKQYYGGSCIVAPDGSELARANEEEGLISAVLDKKMIKEAREKLPYHIDRSRLPIR
ncbi:MAG: carbon-nitrogen hydrolase family protein [Planctomycetes bacterium]|nr:carbon-nitrogen hydrolase family protein [Planctomycetota bacterium]